MRKSAQYNTCLQVNLNRNLSASAALVACTVRELCEVTLTKAKPSKKHWLGAKMTEAV